VKIGHGGTLDPMATGVLIAGIGMGTKHLSDFLSCPKTYETVVLFGAETDSYDRMGKIVRKTGYEHVTRDAVEEAMKKFRGKIMQRPPIFSAKRIQGKRLYEYAREGIEPPMAIKSVPVQVYDLRVLEWYEPGTHEYKWPEEELSAEEKEIAERMLDKAAAIPLASEAEAEAVQANPPEDKKKRKASPGVKSEVVDEAAAKRVKTDTQAAESTTEESTVKEDNTAEEKSEEKEPEEKEPEEKEPEEKEPEEKEPEEKEPEAAKKEEARPPAAKITMTVSSGFYVRSLAHDLGKAVGSSGLMSELVRSKQGDYTLDPEKVLEYADLEAGEEVWGPKVTRFLEEWQEKNPSYLTK
jgi:tRNA pseudouridine55 synthase